MSSYALDLVFAFAIPALPLAVAAALALPRSRGLALALAPWVPAAALALLPALHGRVVELPWLLLGARIGVDALGGPLLLLAAVAWTLAGWHARHHLAEAVQPRFFAFWLLTWTGNHCAFIALDAASFYAAYATMTFAAYGLVVFNGRPADLRAGGVYMIMAVLGEALIIAGLLILGGTLGNIPLGQGAPLAQLPQSQWVTVLLAIGFAVKMGIVPLHMWLALAHPQAPVPASAVLSGVIVKAGLMGWLRFLPLGADGFQIAGGALALAGLFTVFYGAAVSLVQTRAKTVLAYSTVSQMGLIACAVGVALALPEAAPALVPVAVLFALHHGLAKAALFLSVDTAKTHPGVMRAAMWLPAVILAGAPLTSGALAKLLLKGAIPPSWDWLNDALLVSSIATTLIMARFLALAWPRRPGDQRGNPLPWLGLVVAGLGLPWLAASGLESAALGRAFQPAYLLQALWPVAAGIAVVLVAMRWWPRHLQPRLPEGDLVALFAWAWKRGSDVLLPRVPWPSRPQFSLDWLGRMEAVLMRLGPALFIGLLGLGLLVLASR